MHPFNNLNRWRLLRFALILAAMGVLVSIIHHYQLRAAVDRYRAELKRDGYIMDLHAALPPPVPDDQNGAKWFLAASQLLETNPTWLQTNYSLYGMKIVLPGKAMTVSQQSDIRDEDSTNSWPDVAATVKQLQPAYAQLAQINTQPVLDFHVPYERDFDEPLFFAASHVTGLKHAAKYLSAAGLNDLHQRDPASAVSRVQTVLSLADGSQNERTLIAELVGIAIASYARSLTWEILQTPGLTDPQLSRLQAAWENINFLHGYENTLPVEWLCNDQTLIRWRSSNTNLEQYINQMSLARMNMGFDEDKLAGWHKAAQSVHIFCWRYWWSYPDELRFLHGRTVMLETLNQIKKQGGYLPAFQQQESRLSALGFTSPTEELGGYAWVMSLFSKSLDFDRLFSDSIDEYQSTFDKIMIVECSRQMTIAAIALKRYQLTHGDWPEKLADLTPAYLSSLPQDVVVNQPLHYRRNPDGTFLLYSVGENGVDDGGDPTSPPGVENSSNWQNLHARDWVWPQPATPAEIETYYINLKKHH